MRGIRQGGLVGRVGPGLVVLLLAATVARGVVEVNVTRVGYPSLAGGDVVRQGTWVPIVVDLSLVNEAGFDGYVRVGQFDIDGDVAYDRMEVHLRAESGGNQRVFLYAVPNRHLNQDRFLVELFNDRGEAVPVLSQGELTFQARPAQEATSVPDDDLLILSISDGVVGHVQRLLAADRERVYTRPLHIAHMSPRDLPELWIGLEMVDHVVWDDARPEELSQRQVASLIEWVRQGGTLLIAASRTAGAVRAIEALGAVLPVEIGEATTVANLPEERRVLLGPPEAEGTRTPVEASEWWTTPVPTPVPVVRCTLRPGAKRIPDSRDNTSTVLTRKRLGRGSIAFLAVTMRDFFSGSGDPDPFFREVLRLPYTPKSERSANPVYLSPYVLSAIGFATSGSLYWLMAVFFSLGYVGVATFGSWSLLGVRGWRQHSWTVFALVAGVASVVSVLAVNAVRGFGGETLQQVSVIDLDAGQARASATTFFGLKLGTDRVVDLWLPEDPLSAAEPARSNCFLRPLPEGGDSTNDSSSFADPEEYRVEPGSAVVDDVRVRATLKRFEGRWEGLLPGTVTADVTVRGSLIADGSTIVNNLGVDLRDCLLLQPNPSPDLAGSLGPRDRSIYAFPIGSLPRGAKLDLASRCYRPEGNETPEQVRNKSTLATAQKAWGAEFRSRLMSIGPRGTSEAEYVVGQEGNALLLVSTAGDYDPDQDTSTLAASLGPPTWSRDRLRTLDLRDDLERDSAVLIGFADDPGPVRMFRRTGERPYGMLHPDADHSWTMYRVRIPVRVVDPERPEEEAKPVR